MFPWPSTAIADTGLGKNVEKSSPLVAAREDKDEAPGDECAPMPRATYKSSRTAYEGHRWDPPRHKTRRLSGGINSAVRRSRSRAVEIAEPHARDCDTLPSIDDG